MRVGDDRRAMTHVTILGIAAGIPRRLPPGEVWAPNYRPHRPDLRRRLTRSFQLHRLTTIDAEESAWLRACPVPIYTLSSTRQPMWRRYPLGQILPGPLSSSFDYMMALAIREGFRSILLAGVMLPGGTPRERLIEHVSLAYWIGLARGRGIRVRIHARSWVLRAPYRYGYDARREINWADRRVTMAALSILDSRMPLMVWRKGQRGIEKTSGSAVTAIIDHLINQLRRVSRRRCSPRAALLRWRRP